MREAYKLYIFYYKKNYYFVFNLFLWNFQAAHQTADKLYKLKIAVMKNVLQDGQKYAYTNK